MPPSNPLPTIHRAAQYTVPNPLATLRTNPTAGVPPLPRSGTYTLIRVLSCSLNPVDYKLALLPFPLPRLILGSNPITPAEDFVGRVWATTDPRLKGGDIVWGMTQPGKWGSAGEYVVVKGTGWGGKVPDGWMESGRELEELGCVGIAGMTAVQALLGADLGFSRAWKEGRKEGSGGKIFVNGGSGGVGTFMVQMAKRGMGVETVVASCSGANADLVKSLGADEVIDYRRTSVVEELKKWSQRNGGQQFDLIVDNVGADANIYWNSHHYLKPGDQGGQYVTIAGGFSRQQIVDFSKIFLWPRFLGGGQRPFQFMRLGGVDESVWKLVGKWMVEGKVKSVIEDDNRFELEDIGSAFEKLKGGRTRGKIVVSVTKDGE